jgi:hypothetical protein
MGNRRRGSHIGIVRVLLLVVGLGLGGGWSIGAPERLAAQDLDDFFDLPDEVTEPDGPDEDAAGDDGDTGESGADAEGAGGEADGGAGTSGAGTSDGSAAPPEATPPAGIDIAALTTSPTRVTGTVSADAGASLGYNEWPWSDAAEDRDWKDLTDIRAGYAMSASVAVDSRPAPYLRYYAKLTSSLNPTSLGFGTPAVSEMFVDYTLNNTFFRAGKYSMGWGRARLFESPADLVSRVSSGAAMRASVPVGTGSFTTVLYTLRQWIDNHEQGDPRSFAGAVQLEQTRGIFSTELAAHYQYDEGPMAAAVVTMGIRELTLAGEGRYTIDKDNPGLPGDDANRATAIGNFFWENSSRTWSFWGEYSYNADRADAEAGEDGVRRNGVHLAGLAFKAPSLATGGWRPSVSWRHAVADGSGQVIAGTTGTVAPRLELSFGMPLFYGRPGTYYRGISETRIVPEDSGFGDDEEQVLLISGQNVVSVSFGLSLSFSF